MVLDAENDSNKNPCLYNLEVSRKLELRCFPCVYDGEVDKGE